MPESIERLSTALADRYAIERELGSGGMATVYLAEDLKHHRKVAVKVLRPELAASLGPDRFLREIEIAAGLTHPHILTLIDSGQADGFLYYVMPYIEGESLRDKLRSERQLSIDEALAITRALASALDYAHRRGIVHRDIKPENVLLQEGEAVVADFGIARAITAAGTEKLTETGLAVGTPAYMSPEQASGETELDGRSDLYSLACVLYEMLAGDPPFAGSTAQVVMARHSVDAVPPLRTARRTVPDHLEQAITKALAKVPADRFTTAEEFVKALSRADVQPTRRQWMPYAALAVALVAVIAVVWQPWRPGPPQPAPVVVPYVASLAVLPFDNLGSPDDAYFADGMTAEIIGQLGQVEGLKVISRTSVVAIKGSGLTLPQIADTLDVRHIVEGTVRRAASGFRVWAQLIDAETDANLWSDSFDGEMLPNEVIGVQEEIARQVSQALITTVRGLRPLGAGSRTTIAAAYDAYLQGTFWRERRTADGLMRAIAAFKQAIALDTAYAPAYAGLAAALRHWVSYGYPGGPDPYVALAEALENADRAIALDSGLAEGFEARGLATLFAWGPPETILADLERALELKPNSAEIHGSYALGLAYADRYDQALAEAEAAIGLDPLAPAETFTLASVAFGARLYEVVLSQARRSRAIEPGFDVARPVEALALVMLGRANECLQLELGPYEPLKVICAQALGQTEQAEAGAASLREQFVSGEYRRDVAAILIGLHAQRGEVDLTVEWLDRAFAISPYGVGFWFLDSDFLDRVRNTPEFRSLMERVRTEIPQRVERERRLLRDSGLGGMADRAVRR